MWKDGNLPLIFPLTRRSHSLAIIFWLHIFHGWQRGASRRWMAELPRPALFILVPTCHRAPTTTRCSQTCFILLYRSFFQRLKAELLGCCPTAHCTVGMYRTALILEQTVGHFTFLSLSLFSFFFPWAHAWYRRHLHGFGISQQSCISPMRSICMKCFQMPNCWGTARWEGRC